MKTLITALLFAAISLSANAQQYLAATFPGLSNFSDANMAKWKTAVASVVANESNARIAAYGNSTTAGALSDGTQFGLKINSYPAVLASLLNATVATATNNSFFGDQNIPVFGGTYSTYNPTISAASGWTNPTVVLGGDDWFNNSTTNILAWSPGVSFDTIDIYTLANNSAFNVNFDGGSNTLLTPATGIAQLQKFSLSTTLGTHTVNITRPSGLVHIVGAVVYTAATKQIEVANFGQYGVQTGGLAASVNTYDPLPSLQLFSPNITIVDLGINDLLSNSTTLATSQTNTQTIVTVMVPFGPVILVVPNPINPAQAGASLAQQQAYAAMLQGLSISNNVPLLNLQTLFGGSYAAANAAGLMGDSNHPSQLGYQLIAAALAQVLVVR